MATDGAMDAERARRLEQLYHSALEYDATERAAFLHSACGADAALRRELESLLAYDQQAADFIETPALNVAARLTVQEKNRTDQSSDTNLVGRTISHYSIIEKLGGGGMGVVYKARDLRLGRPVALKFLPEEFAHDSNKIERFKREARAASSLNHPHICTIYDIGESEGRAFIAMECLDGGTLKHLIQSQPLETRTLLTLAVQIAGALESAHSQSIIHRDIKPANIFVTRRGDAKILDFGLAKLTAKKRQGSGIDASGLDQAEWEPELTIPGIAIGTVAYMSPEQARGEELDVRTDLFSFGAVLYEMGSGQKAFAGAAFAKVFDAILNHDPTPLAGMNQALPTRFVEIVNKSLAKDREARYQSATDMLNDLKTIEGDLHDDERDKKRSIVRSGPTVTSSSRRYTWLSLAAVAAVLTAVLVASYFWMGRHRGSANSTANKARRSVAVLGLRNLSGKAEVAWLSTALSEMLTTELAAGEKLRTISGEDVSHAQASLLLPEADSLSPNTLKRVHQSLGTDFVVLGSYLDLAGQIRLDLRLQDASIGETIATVSGEGSEVQLLDLISRTGEQLREKLGIGTISAADAVTVRASLPSNPDAARLYSQGLAKLRAYDALAARDLLQEAVAAESKYPLSHAALARVWTALGYDQKAKAEATKAFQLAGTLSREDRLAVEGRYWLVEGDYNKAIQAYRALFTLFPDNLDYGLDLAKAQDDAGKLEDALSTLDVLRKLPPPLGDDPRIDLQTAGATDDHAKALAANEQVIRKAQDQEAKWLVARARGSECVHFMDVGQLNEAFAACQKAQQTYAAAGDRNGEAKELNDLAAICIQEGKLAEAKRLFQAALLNFRAIGNDEAIAATLANLGASVYGEGNLPEAEHLYRDALPKYRKVEDTEGESYTLLNLGQLYVNQGKLRQADASYQQGLTVAQRAASKRALGYGFAGLGNLQLREGNLAAARKSQEQSLGLRQEIGEKATAAESHTFLAELMIESGNAAVAEKLAREAVSEFQSDQQADDEVTAAAVLINAQLAQGKWADAEATVKTESGVAARTQDQTIAPKFAIAAARSMGASGKVAEATSSLETTLKNSIKRGFVDYEYDARLALAEIEMRSGKTALGRAHLAQLEKNAAAKGFALLAHKAATAAQNNDPPPATGPKGK